MTNKEELFEEAGVVYSHEYEADMTAHHYTSRHERLGIEVKNTVYVMGDTAAERLFDTLLAHWNRAGEWRYDEL